MCEQWWIVAHSPPRRQDCLRGAFSQAASKQVELGEDTYHIAKLAGTSPGPRERQAHGGIPVHLLHLGTPVTEATGTGR